MTRPPRPPRRSRALLVLALLAGAAALGIGAGAARNPPSISLDAPVSFPADI